MKKIAIIIGVVILICILIAGFFILNKTSKPLSESEKEKALAKILSRKVNLQGRQVAKGDVEYKGKYLRFFYPASATIYHNLVNGKEVVDKNTLEYFAFDMYDPRVLVTVAVVPASSVVSRLIDYPGIRLRQTQKDIYKETKIQADNVNGLLYDKNDLTGFEKTAFFYTGSKVYSFSVQSADQKVLSQVFNKMITTTKFL